MVIADILYDDLGTFKELSLGILIAGCSCNIP